MDPAARRLTLLPLAAATFFVVSGGPYGLEEIVLGHGYGRTVALLGVLPLLWSLPVALMVGELASALPRTGGYYVWVRRALGPFWGLQQAWLSLSFNVFDLAIYPVLFATYLAHLWPALGRTGMGEPGWLLAVGMIAACTAWNALGVRAVGRGAEAIGALLLAPFAVMVAVAVASGEAGLDRLRESLLAAPPDSAGSAWVAGLLVAMWNTQGWDGVSTVAGEVERPERTYPRAMLLTVVAVTLVYLLPVLAAASTGMPPAQWAAGAWVEVGRRLGGRLLALAIVLGGALSMVGMFTAILMAWSRLLVALSQDGWLPATFSRRSRRTGAPISALLVGALFCAAVAGLGLRRLVEIDVLLYGAGLTLEFVALVVLRLREPDLPRPFRVPGGLAGAVALGLAPTLLLAAAAWQARDEPGMAGLTAVQLAGLAAVAGPIWYLARGRAATAAEPGER